MLKLLTESINFLEDDTYFVQVNSVVKMSYVPTTRMFLRGFDLYPHKSIQKTGIFNTLRIIVTSLPLWFVGLTNYAYFEANLKTADIAVITDAMYTNFDVFQLYCADNEKISSTKSYRRYGSCGITTWVSQVFHWILCKEILN